MISSKPPPQLKDESKWSAHMIDFVRLCLTKDPLLRPHSKDLLTHPWIASEIAILNTNTPYGSSLPILKELVNNNWQAILDMRIAMQQQITPIDIPTEDYTTTNTTNATNTTTIDNNTTKESILTTTSTSSTYTSLDNNTNNNNKKISPPLSPLPPSSEARIHINPFTATNNGTANSNNNNNNNNSTAATDNHNTNNNTSISTDGTNTSTNTLTSAINSSIKTSTKLRNKSYIYSTKDINTDSIRLKSLSTDDTDYSDPLSPRDYDITSTSRPGDTTSRPGDTTCSPGDCTTGIYTKSGRSSGDYYDTSHTTDRDTTTRPGDTTDTTSSNKPRGRRQGSIIRIMIPQPVTHMIPDGYTPRNTTCSVLSGRSSSSSNASDNHLRRTPGQYRDSLSSRGGGGYNSHNSSYNNLRMTPGQFRDTNRMSLNQSTTATLTTSTAASLIYPNPTVSSIDINTSVIRSNSTNNPNITAALKYFQEMRNEENNTIHNNGGTNNNNLMLSRNRFFANMMVELQLNTSSKNPSVIGGSESVKRGTEGTGSIPVSARSYKTDKTLFPSFDPEKLTSEQKITYNILLSYIEADYIESTKLIEQEYVFKKQQLYTMYDMFSDNSSG